MPTNITTIALVIFISILLIYFWGVLSMKQSKELGGWLEKIEALFPVSVIVSIQILKISTAHEKHLFVCNFFIIFTTFFQYSGVIWILLFSL